MNKEKEIKEYFETRLEALADLTDEAKQKFLTAQKQSKNDLMAYSAMKLAKYTNEYNITATIYAELNVIID